MAKIILQGNLGQKFGEEWDISVSTPKEALRALEANTQGGFSSYLQSSLKDKEVPYKMVVDGYELIDEADSTLLNKPLSDSSVIEFIPTLGGHGILTAIFIAIINVVVTVIANALAPSPKVDFGNGQTAKRESFLFNGREGAVKQGNPVPVGYGRMLVPAVPISLDYVYSNVKSGGGSYRPRPNDAYWNDGYWEDYYWDEYDWWNQN